MVISWSNDSIFEGLSPKPIRDAAAEYIKAHKFKNLIIPCCGRFTTAEVVIKAGFPANKIICGDISLVSSVLGYYFAGKDLAELGITSEYSFIDSSRPAEEYVASILYGIKVSHAKDNNYYAAEIKKGLLRDPERQIKKIAESLSKMYDVLKGIDYQIVDMRDLLEDWKDTDALIYLEPPAYGAKKYADMCDGGDKISWKKPSIPYFGEKGDMEKLVKGLSDTTATVMLEIFKDRSAVPETWVTYEMAVDTKLKGVFLFLNKDEEGGNINRPRLHKNKPLPYPIINQKDEITEASVASAEVVGIDVANYYRDLFTHKLGASMADTNVLFRIDGKIVAIRGYSSPAQSIGELNEIYGIVHNNTRYKHLGRLIMRLMTTRQFERVINKTLFDLKEITSTKLSKHREYREAKGILEEYSHENLKDGTHKTKYRAQFCDKTFSDCIKEWLKEEASYGQPKQRKRKVRAVSGTRG